MPSWLRRRRKRFERIEIEADALICDKPPVRRSTGQHQDCSFLNGEEWPFQLRLNWHGHETNPKQTPSLETEVFGRRLSSVFDRKRQTNPQYCCRRPESATLTLSNVGRSWNRGNRRRSCGLPGGGRSPQKPVCGGRSFRIIPTFAFNVFLRGPKRGFLSIETLVFSTC